MTETDPKTLARTIDDINREYHNYAVLAGHKQRVLEEIQEEIKQHLLKMREINQEAKIFQNAQATQLKVAPKDSA